MVSDINQEPLSDKVFHRLMTLLHQSRRHARLMMDESGMTPRDFAVLRYLTEIDAATVGQVQAYLHKSPSTTSALLSQLEDKGYLTRTRSPEDNRVVIVSLTSTGHELANNTPLGGLPLLRRKLGNLPEPRLLEIQTVLNEILELMEVAAEE